MTADQEQRLKEITAEALGVDVEEVNDETSPQTLAGWNSFNHLTLMSTVEEAYGIMFSMDDMTGVHNFPDLKQLVTQHLS